MPHAEKASKKDGYGGSRRPNSSSAPVDLQLVPPKRCPGEESLGPGGDRTEAQDPAKSTVCALCSTLSLPGKEVLQWIPGLLIPFLPRKHLPPLFSLALLCRTTQLGAKVWPLDCLMPWSWKPPWGHVSGMVGDPVVSGDSCCCVTGIGKSLLQPHNCSSNTDRDTWRS